MNVIYPLAVPKGRRLCCEVCEAPAERMCMDCTVTYYWSPTVTVSLAILGAERLGRIVQAEEYLSQARWTVLKSTDCSNATHSLLHRNLGLLYMAKENFEEARYHLANDIYFASCAFGTDDIRTSGGYFHLANIFYALSKMGLADTLYTKVSEIWFTYLNDHYQVLLQARSQQTDLLGKQFVNDTGLDEAQEAEAIQILTSILNIRESSSSKAPQKTVFIMKTLSMLYYLMLECSMTCAVPQGLRGPQFYPNGSTTHMLTMSTATPGTDDMTLFTVTMRNIFQAQELT
ncbi:zinc finger MYND domain containing 12 [Cricetulus griseus]